MRDEACMVVVVVHAPGVGSAAVDAVHQAGSKGVRISVVQRTAARSSLRARFLVSRAGPLPEFRMDAAVTE